MEYEPWLLLAVSKMRAAGRNAFCTKPGGWWFEKWKAGVAAEAAVATALKEG